MAWMGLAMAYLLRSNKAILDFLFPDDNLLTVNGLDIEHNSGHTWDLGINNWWP